MPVELSSRGGFERVKRRKVAVVLNAPIDDGVAGWTGGVRENGFAQSSEFHVGTLLLFVQTEYWSIGLGGFRH